VGRRAFDFCIVTVLCIATCKIKKLYWYVIVFSAVIIYRYIARSIIFPASSWILMIRDQKPNYPGSVIVLFQCHILPARCVLNTHDTSWRHCTYTSVYYLYTEIYLLDHQQLPRYWICVLLKLQELLTTWETASFPKMKLLRGIRYNCFIIE
jgi:hypothetical protein